MKHLYILLLVPVAGLLAACQAQTTGSLNVSAFAEEQQFMREYGSALPPIGYVSFCQREPAECVSGSANTSRGDDTSRVAMTAEHWVTLNDINTDVNRLVIPATDQEIYQRPEYWALPGVTGDCEDYVLQKRKLLVARGWSESALLITVVRDEMGEGHAVLTARTDMGDLILDNRLDLIRPWSDTGYVYYKRQSRNNPRQWVALTPFAQSNTALAATRQAQQ